MPVVVFARKPFPGFARGVRVARKKRETMKDARRDMAVKHLTILTIIALFSAHEKFIQGNKVVETTSESQHQLI